MKTTPSKNRMIKIKAKEKKKAYTCRCHLLDRRDLVLAHRLDELLPALPVSPIAKLTGKETTGSVKANHI